MFFLEVMRVASYILYGIGVLCLIGAFQERKDFLRAFGFFCVALIFGFVGLVVANI